MTERYDYYRGQVKTGDLIQFESKDIVSRIIAWRTGSLVSHSAMAFWLTHPLGTTRLYILESVMTGLQLNYLSRRLGWHLPHGDMYWHKMKPQYEKWGPTAADNLLQHVGTFYDFKDLIIQAVKRVTLDPAKLFCSEAVAFAWRKIACLPEDYIVPYPSEMATDKLGVYQEEGTLLT